MPPQRQVARPSGNRLRVRVVVQAPPWMEVNRIELVHDGDAVRALPVRPQRAIRRDRGQRIEVTSELQVEHDGWLVVVARGERTMDEVLVRPVRPSRSPTRSSSTPRATG